MLFENRSALLKSGIEVTLRSCLEADVAAFRELVADYLTNSPYIPRKLHEFNPSDDELFNWINGLNTSDNSFLIVAEHNGKLIGNLDVRGSDREVMAHTGYIGMGMRMQYRNTGLGTVLMENAIQLSRETGRLDYLWLQVYAANEVGRALYLKAGFRECGLQTGFLRDGSESFDLITMELQL